MNRLRNRYRQWRDLRPWERRALARLAWRLPAAWLLLRLLGFKKTHRLAGEAGVAAPSRPLPQGLNADEYAQRCAELAAIAARHGLYRANCLHQSLALCSLLRRDGLQTRLRIGVEPGSRPFIAHAWVELDGKPLGQQSVAGYQAFEQLMTGSDKVLFQ